MGDKSCRPNEVDIWLKIPSQTLKTPLLTALTQTVLQDIKKIF